MIRHARLQSFAVSAAILTTGVSLPRPTAAQDTKAASRPDSIAAIEAQYKHDLDEIERKRLERLAALAAHQPKDEADRTYESYFRSAITNNLFAEAEPVAERVLKSKDASSHVVFLAHVANIMAEAGRGAYDESLASLTATLVGSDAKEPTEQAARALPLAARLSLLDAYFQRLVQGDQFEVAHKAFALVRDKAGDPAVKAFAAARLARLDLVGKPAPVIGGTDVDGHPVRLANYKGDVVLVVFWASWCLPNAEEVSRLEAMASMYSNRGLKILGINLDSLQSGGKSPESVLPAVRQFLLDHNVRWPNLINGTGERDYARAYAVAEIPANVLIGRDGTVIHLDLARSNLEKVIARAVAR
jgi:peroxiredoxin